MARSLGWAVVGCGWVARDFVVPAIQASANGHLVAACDLDPQALSALGGDVAPYVPPVVARFLRRD